MIFFIIIAVFLTFLLWILLVPVIVRVDTEYNRYAVSLPGIFNVYVVPKDGLFFLRIWIFFIPLKFDPFRMRRRKSRKPRKKNPDKKKKRSWLRAFSNKKASSRMLRAVKIRRLEMDIDTDDFTLNAWLVPVFTMVNGYDNIDLRVNFEGMLNANMEVRARLGEVLWLMASGRLRKN